MIRPERPDDHDEIAAVVAAAFGSEREARFVDKVRASPNLLVALVAEEDGRIVGHVMLSTVTLRGADGADRPIASLAPLAVAPDRQRDGIGSALVRAVLAEADERGEPLVVLEGSPDYYPRFGFEPAHERDIRMPLPEWAAPEAAQVACLTQYDPSLTGRVVYPPAFDEVSAHDV